MIALKKHSTKTDFDLFPGKQEDAKRFFDEEQTIMKTGKPVLHREWMVPSTTTGETVWLSESKLPICDESGEIVGLLGIGRDITVRREAEVLLEQATIEIKALNAHLTNLVDRDGLTGIYNRRFFNEYFEIELQRAMNFLKHRNQLESTTDPDLNFGLAMIDIDYFKHINDTYGHLVGDDVLKQVINIIKQNIFSRDVLCRYGGDEFVLILTKTSSSGIIQATEKIRKKIDEHKFDLCAGHENQHVTISMGLVNFNEVLHRKGEEILKLADDRLRCAKEYGRNRVVYNDKH